MRNGEWTAHPSNTATPSSIADILEKAAVRLGRDNPSQERVGACTLYYRPLQNNALALAAGSAILPWTAQTCHDRAMPPGKMILATGDRIGDYEVLAPLGAGGMGSVYKVRHAISQRVEALKVILPNAAGASEMA